MEKNFNEKFVLKPSAALTNLTKKFCNKKTYKSEQLVKKLLLKKRNLIFYIILVVQLLALMNEKLLFFVKNKTETVNNRMKEYRKKL